MTTTHEAPSPPASDDAEALFPEARRRRHRIRFIAGAICVALVVAAAGLVYGISRDGGAPKAPSPGPAISGPSQITTGPVLRDTVAARSAHEDWRTITSYPGCSPPQAGSGVLDLAHLRSAVTVSSPGCRSGNGSYTQRGSYRNIQIGMSVYQTRLPQETWDYGSGKSWLLLPQYTSAWLATDDPLRVLSAVSGPLMRVGASDVRGVATTEYVGSATLASMLAATQSGNSGPIGTPDPALKQIPIQVSVWVDPQRRVRQISTWEPLYTQNDIGGASQGGPYIVSSSSPKPAAPPRQQGYVQTTLDLWQFGTEVHVSPPPAATVATPG